VKMKHCPCKAIRTKYLPPTDRRGARIVASDSDGNRVVIGYPHELDGVECHQKAADALCAKLNWTGTLYAGGDGPRGWVFVFAHDPIGGAK